jgi:hypothetical protein
MNKKKKEVTGSNTKPLVNDKETGAKRPFSQK